MPETLPSNARVRVVMNPVAGQAESYERDVRAAMQIWQLHGWSVELALTRQSGDAVRLAREAAQQGYDLVVAAGGDGTVNEVANGLAHTRTALGALPVGTVNVWVREIGLPLQPRATAEALLTAHVRRIDLGRAGDRYFLLMAGVGFDAAVVSEVRSDEKRRLGILAYALRMFDVAWRYRGTRARMVIDGRTVRGHVLLVVLGNSQLYGGLIKITNRASLDDGLLDVCIIKGTNLWSIPERALHIMLGRHSDDPEMEYHRARTVLIETRRTLPVQVDGDEGGFTPMSFQVAPGALHALLPPSLPPALLRPTPPLRRRLRQRMLGWLGRWRGR